MSAESQVVSSGSKRIFKATPSTLLQTSWNVVGGTSNTVLLGNRLVVRLDRPVNAATASILRHTYLNCTYVNKQTGGTKTSTVALDGNITDLCNEIRFRINGTEITPVMDRSQVHFQNRLLFKQRPSDSLDLTKRSYYSRGLPFAFDSTSPGASQGWYRLLLLGNNSFGGKSEDCAGQTPPLYFNATTRLEDTLTLLKDMSLTGINSIEIEFTLIGASSGDTSLHIGYRAHEGATSTLADDFEIQNVTVQSIIQSYVTVPKGIGSTYTQEYPIWDYKRVPQATHGLTAHVGTPANSQYVFNFSSEFGLLRGIKRVFFWATPATEEGNLTYVGPAPGPEALTWEVPFRCQRFNSKFIQRLVIRVSGRDWLSFDLGGSTPQQGSTAANPTPAQTDLNRQAYFEWIDDWDQNHHHSRDPSLCPAPIYFLDQAGGPLAPFEVSQDQMPCICVNFDFLFSRLPPDSELLSQVNSKQDFIEFVLYPTDNAQPVTGTNATSPLLTYHNVCTVPADLYVAVERQTLVTVSNSGAVTIAQ
jgi:hypothetical protein